MVKGASPVKRHGPRRGRRGIVVAGHARLWSEPRTNEVLPSCRARRIASAGAGVLLLHMIDETLENHRSPQVESEGADAQSVGRDVRPPFIQLRECIVRRIVESHDPPQDLPDPVGDPPVGNGSNSVVNCPCRDVSPTRCSRTFRQSWTSMPPSNCRPFARTSVGLAVRSCSCDRPFGHVHWCLLQSALQDTIFFTCPLNDASIFVRPIVLLGID